jgi:hypothetical protein
VQSSCQPKCETLSVLDANGIAFELSDQQSSVAQRFGDKMSTNNESSSIQNSTSSMTRFLSLPYELLQSIFGSITNFEPWTYTSIPENTGTGISDEELLLYTRDAEPINLVSTHRTMLGLSSEDSWLVLVLSRHPYHLSRGDNSGVSSAITQALRRMNARLEQKHWSDRELRARLSTREDRTMPREKGEGRNNAARQTASMKQYHASVHTEEESWLNDNEVIDAAHTSNALSNKRDHSMNSALVVHRPVPVLKITGQDFISNVHTTPPADAIQQFSALLVAVLITLAQCRMNLLENLETLERDTPIPSIEPHEPRASATPKMSPRHDRLRSMSGSTVAESMPQGETLALSAISTVYNSSMDGSQTEVRWAEKRLSEERDVGTSPKRPKLTEYKQVSSGRVASLMDRFEKFHL